LASRSLKPARETAAIVKAIEALGGQVLVRSSVGQGAGCPEIGWMACEGNNSIYGQPKNPHNKEYSTGGSCGGEAGLVATQSVGMGLGVDLYGDAKYPASCCGLACFRPTSTRISNQGIPSATRSSPLVKPVISPISRSVKDITHLLTCLWDSQITETHFDRSIIPQPFDAGLWGHEEKRPFRIGYYFDDGIHECSHPMREALLLVKSSLEAQGYTLIEFTLGAQPEQETLREMLETAWRIEGAAGGLNGYKN
jgi:amidase